MTLARGAPANSSERELRSMRAAVLTTTAVVDNLLDYTADVSIALSLPAVSPAIPADVETNVEFCGAARVRGRTKSRVRNWAGALFRRVLAVKIEPRPLRWLRMTRPMATDFAGG